MYTDVHCQTLLSWLKAYVTINAGAELTKQRLRMGLRRGKPLMCAAGLAVLLPFPPNVDSGLIYTHGQAPDAKNVFLKYITNLAK